MQYDPPIHSLAAFVAAIATIAALAACTTDVANRYYAHVKYPAKQPSQVLILRGQPSQAYEVIADFQSLGESPEDVRDKAAEIGADAVIISRIGGSYHFDEEWADQDRFAGTGRRIVGTAIIFKKGEPKK